jgi:ADP-ribose pyrophosphatase YjhB (NUDIX family)
MMVWVMRLAFWLMRVKWWITRPIAIGVRMVLLQDGQVVLVRHTYSRGWHFPGGALKWGETPAEAATREAAEEAGAQLLAPVELLGVFSSFGEGKSDHVVAFLCREFHLGQASDRWEIAECRLFAVDALPQGLGMGARRLLKRLAAQPYVPVSRRW